MAAFVLPLRSLSLTCAAVGINTFVKCTTLLPLKYKCAQTIGCNIFSAHYLHSFIKKKAQNSIYTHLICKESAQWSLKLNSSHAKQVQWKHHYVHTMGIEERSITALLKRYGMFEEWSRRPRLSMNSVHQQNVDKHEQIGIYNCAIAVLSLVDLPKLCSVRWYLSRQFNLYPERKSHYTGTSKIWSRSY